MTSDLRVAERKGGKNLDGVAEPLPNQPRSRSSSGLFLWGRTKLIFMPVKALLVITGARKLPFAGVTQLRSGP